MEYFENKYSIFIKKGIKLVGHSDICIIYARKFLDKVDYVRQQ